MGGGESYTATRSVNNLANNRIVTIEVQQEVGNKEEWINLTKVSVCRENS